MLKKGILVSSLSIIIYISFSQDTLLLYKNNEEVKELKIENRILVGKVDALNAANDKILNTVYWTLGTILTALIGLSVWNAIKAQKINRDELRRQVEEIRKELLELINARVEERVKSKSFSELSDLRSEINLFKSAFNDFKENHIIRNFKYHPYYGANHSELESSKLFELISFTLLNKSSSAYEVTLQAIKNFFKGDEYIYESDIPRILHYLDNEFSAPQFKYYVADIKALIERREQKS